MAIPSLIERAGTSTTSKIGIIDRTDNYHNVLNDNDIVHFEILDNQTDEDSIKTNLQSLPFDGFLIISGNPQQQGNAKLYSAATLPFDVTNHIENGLREKIRNDLLNDYAQRHSTQSESLDSLVNTIRDVQASVSTININQEGSENETNTTISGIFAIICCLVIYIFLCVYGSMVMTGVIEEKSSRIMEVLVSSVKPYQLLMGKIVGVVGVAITQLIFWVMIGSVIFTIGMQILQPTPEVATAEIGDANLAGGMVSAIQSFDFVSVIAAAIFFTIGGILLYSTVFAAIGSGVNSPSEGQQLTSLIMLTIVISIYFALAAARDPNGALAIWTSIIPLTSPVVMMARIPFGVPTWQIAVSVIALIINIILFIWMAGRIYRVGILMYGKPATWKELWRWFRQSN